MKKYRVTISETYKKTVEIKANSRDEAEEIASNGWLHKEYSLDGSNFEDVKFNVRELKNREPER